MIIYDEPAEKYHARKALSAGMIWTWINECPRQAWYESPFNPYPGAKAKATYFDVGQALHLAILESRDFAARCSLVVAEDYKTKEARAIRDQCYADGKIPLLPQDYDLVNKMRGALERSGAADLLFREGRNEVTYTWDISTIGTLTDRSRNDIDGDGRVTYDLVKFGCEGKARADRIIPNAIIDLKTATSASPAAFQRAMIRDGHHVRAAWYLDGYADGGPKIERLAKMDYLFVVVAKTPPHLVEVYSVDERSLAWGRTLIKKALHEFRRAWEDNYYPGYSRQGSRITSVPLPAFAENLLRSREMAGEFDDQDDSEISY